MLLRVKSWELLERWEYVMDFLQMDKIVCKRFHILSVNSYFWIGTDWKIHVSMSKSGEGEWSWRGRLHYYLFWGRMDTLQMKSELHCSQDGVNLAMLEPWGLFSTEARLHRVLESSCSKINSDINLTILQKKDWGIHWNTEGNFGMLFILTELIWATCDKCNYSYAQGYCALHRICKFALKAFKHEVR